MTDPTQTEATSKSLFGWSSPGRTLALIIVGAAFGGLLLAAWIGGAL